jgi:hypothetical protein
MSDKNSCVSGRPRRRLGDGDLDQDRFRLPLIATTLASPFRSTKFAQEAMIGLRQRTGWQGRWSTAGAYFCNTQVYRLIGFGQQQLGQYS